MAPDPQYNFLGHFSCLSWGHDPQFLTEGFLESARPLFRFTSWVYTVLITYYSCTKYVLPGTFASARKTSFHSEWNKFCDAYLGMLLSSLINGINSRTRLALPLLIHTSVFARGSFFFFLSSTADRQDFKFEVCSPITRHQPTTPPVPNPTSRCLQNFKFQL